jgi:hypothetical protein
MGSIAPARAEPERTPQPETISFFGMNTYITGQERYRNDGEEGVAALVNLGREAGVAWAREEMSWANLETHAKGAWNWRFMDNRVSQLADAGYGIVGMLLTTPKWARVGDCAARARRAATLEYWCPPANPRDYADYVWTVIERYDGDGVFDAPGSPRIAAWQIWNEPSAPLTWPGSAREYGEMLVMAYKAGKAADPTATIALGGMYIFDGLGTDPTDAIPFLDAMVREAPESIHTFDALAIHPYMTAAAPDAPGIHATITLWGRIQRAQRWLRDHPGIAGVRPLWISELGWSNCRCGDERCDPSLTRDEQLPARYLVRSHAIALALGVQHISYFQLEDKFDGRDGKLCDNAAGVIDIRASGYRRTPAFDAYRAMVGVLGGASFREFGRLHSYRLDPNDQNYAGFYHLRFNAPGGARIDVLWRTVGTQAIDLPLDARHTAELITRDGARTPINGARARLTIGEDPIYIRQSPAGR